MFVPHYLGALVCAAALAAPPDAQPPAPVQYADVLRMVKDEFKEEKIVRLVRQSPTRFVLGAAQEAELKAAGAGPALLAALRNPPPAVPTGSDVGAVVLVLDCSGSMAEPVAGGGTKWAAARQTALDLVDGVTDGRDVALIAYGADAARECASVDVLREMAPATADTRAELRRLIGGLKPAGHTPIAKSLAAAGRQLARTDRPAKVILVTDGMETCHGDPAAIAAALKAACKHLQSVEVIGLGLKDEEKAAVAAIAKAGAGRFHDAQSAGGLIESVKRVTAAVAEPAEPARDQARGGADELTAAERAEFDLMHVYCWDNTGGYDSVLDTEVLVNGRSAGVVRPKSMTPIGRLLTKGENVIQFRTFCGCRSASDYAIFRMFDFGPARRSENQMVMDRVIWRYSNVPGWEFSKGTRTWVYKPDPDARDATVTARAYFTGLRCERVARNDYVLHADVQFANRELTCPLTATAFVNDVPVNSVFGLGRAVSISPWLRPGANTVRLVVRGLESHLVGNNPLKLSVGQAKFDAGAGRFRITPRFTQAAEEDLRRDDDGKWVSAKDPKADTVTYTHELVVDEPPAKR